MADDVRHDAHRANTTSRYCGRYEGKDAVMQRLQAIARDLILERYEPVTVIAEGAQVAAIVRIAGIGRHTGTTFDTRAALFIVVAEGKVTDIEEIFDTAAVAIAVGEDDAAPAAPTEE